MDDTENINRLVHQALGLGCFHESSDTDRATVHCDHCGNGFGGGAWESANPDYTNNIAEAMRFAEKLIADGWDIQIENEDSVIGGWLCVVWNGQVIGGAFGRNAFADKSLAKAICLAGLAAISEHSKV